MATEQKITCTNIWKLFGPDEKRIIKDLDKSLTIKEVQEKTGHVVAVKDVSCLLYTSPSPRDLSTSRMPSSA